MSPSSATALFATPYPHESRASTIQVFDFCCPVLDFIVTNGEYAWVMLDKEWSGNDSKTMGGEKGMVRVVKFLQGKVRMYLSYDTLLFIHDNCSLWKVWIANSVHFWCHSTANVCFLVCKFPSVLSFDLIFYLQPIKKPYKHLAYMPVCLLCPKTKK
jgi:hypothetical protein